MRGRERGGGNRVAMCFTWMMMVNIRALTSPNFCIHSLSTVHHTHIREGGRGRGIVNHVRIDKGLHISGSFHIENWVPIKVS